MRYKEAFNRDYDFYLRCIPKGLFCGAEIKEPAFNADGKDAKRCFFEFDSNGFYPAECSEPKLFAQILQAKKGVNFQVKQWKDGQKDSFLFNSEMVACFDNPPDWLVDIINAIGIKD